METNIHKHYQVWNFVLNPFPCLCNNDSDEEDEFDQECHLPMAFEDESDDNFMDALEEKDVFIEEISQLKICLEEAKLA